MVEKPVPISNFTEASINRSFCWRSCMRLTFEPYGRPLGRLHEYTGGFGGLPRFFLTGGSTASISLIFPMYCFSCFCSPSASLDGSTDYLSYSFLVSRWSILSALTEHELDAHGGCSGSIHRPAGVIRRLLQEHYI